MKNLLVILALLLSSTYCTAKEDKSEDKNRKAVEKEEQHFQKSIRKDPNNAEAYLEHANTLAGINSEAARAKGFYQLALKLDSANPAAYKNYGKYLAERMRDYDAAKIMLTRSQALAPNDDETKKYMESVNKILAMQAEENRMRDFGNTDTKELNPGINYTSNTKFDSLRIIVSDAGNQYHYEKLLARFQQDEQLTPAEMYLLMVGYSKQPTYNPFNYNDVYALRSLGIYNIDSAITKGKELIQNNPLNPSLNRELMYYYRKKNNQAEADKYLNRIKEFFSGVLYSGNGTCEKPYVSLWAKEEYNFITYLGDKSTDSHSMGMCAGQMAEIIEVQNNTTHATENIHFNVALIYMQAVGK